MTEQREHLERVTARIADAILSFAAAHAGEQWHVEALRRHVERVVGLVAPASADRVLRQLRVDRRLNYRVVSRRASLYEWRPIPRPVSDPKPQRLF